MTSSAFLAVAGAGSSRMFSLSPVNLIIIAIYFLVVLGIGFYLKKYAVKAGT